MTNEQKGNRLAIRHRGQTLSIYREGANGEQIQVVTIFPEELGGLLHVLAKIRAGNCDVFNPRLPVPVAGDDSSGA